MKRRGQAGPSGYGIGGLVPRAPASPGGKFLSATGAWEVPAGGSSSAAATQIVSAGTTLSIGTISDGQIMKRSGSSVIGVFLAVALVCVDDGGDAFDAPSNVLDTPVVVVAAGAPS